MPDTKRKPIRLSDICADVCDYLCTKDAYTGELADHCACAVVSINRATKLLRKAGAPLRLIRNSVNGITEFYWRLDRKLAPGEAEAFAAFVFLPEERAQKLLQVVQSAQKTS